MPRRKGRGEAIIECDYTLIFTVEQPRMGPSAASEPRKIKAA